MDERKFIKILIDYGPNKNARSYINLSKNDIKSILFSKQGGVQIELSSGDYIEVDTTDEVNINKLQGLIGVDISISTEILAVEVDDNGNNDRINKLKNFNTYFDNDDSMEYTEEDESDDWRIDGDELEI